MSDAVSYQDTERLLVKLGDATEHVVLVGGQALNFWAEQTRHRSPELEKERPFTSKDTDFLVDDDRPEEQVKEIARRIC